MSNDDFSYIDVTNVLRQNNALRRSKFINFFLKDLFKHTGIEYRTNQVDYKHEDEKQDEEEPWKNTYRWHAELSKTTNSSKSKTYWEEDTEFTIRNKLSAKYHERDDEPYVMKSI